jgi:hypothetical protein
MMYQPSGNRFNPTGRVASDSELTKILGLKSNVDTSDISAALTDIHNRAHARLDFPGSIYIKEQDKHLVSLWNALRASFNIPDAGVIFPATFQIRRDSDLESLKKLRNFVEPIVPLSASDAQEILKTRDRIKNNRLKGPLEDQKAEWNSCISQAEQAIKGQAAFITPEELALYKQFSVSPVAQELNLGGKIGRTGLVWIQFDGEWHPCFPDSRYTNSKRSILQMTVPYLESCCKEARLPRDPEARRQQLVILKGAISAKESGEGEQFLEALRRKYEPRGQKPRGL